MIHTQRIAALTTLTLTLSFACGGGTDDDDASDADASSQSGGSGAEASSGGEDGAGAAGSGGTSSGGKDAGSGGEESSSGGDDSSGGDGGEVGGSGGEACVPTTCEAEGKDCGTLDDGCEGALECGTCEEGTECGALTENVCGCTGGETLSTGQHHARAARNGTFDGTDDDYFAIYDESCVEAEDCLAPCLSVGGNDEFCDAILCQESTENYCLPPSKWTRLDKLLFEGASLDDTARMILGSFNGPFQDSLVAHDFKFEVPEGATIEGVTITFHRATSSDEAAADKAVRLVKGGIIGDFDRGEPTIWPRDLHAAEYGGAADLWGEELTSADVNSPDFGAAITVLPVGSGEAFVDIVYAEVHYRLECE
jgi:hypothetical protein